MQAIITREEWEDYQRLKRESVAEGKVIDLRVADEMEKIAQAYSKYGEHSLYSSGEICESIKYAASIVRAHLNATRLEIHHK